MRGRWSIATAVTHQIRQQTQAPQVPDTRLSRLGLLLAADDRDERDIDQCKVLMADAELELAHRLDERRALDVADSSAELDDADVGLLARLVDGDARDALDPVLDRVGQVRDDLHRLAEVVAAALALDDVLVDLARGDVVVLGEGHVEVALVVAQVQVGLAAVVENVDLAWAGGAWMV